MKFRLLVVSILTSVLACGKSPERFLNGITIIQDESRGNAWGLWDTGFYGYSELARIARRAGASVSVNTAPLDSLKVLRGNAGQNILLILGVAKFARYEARELRAIQGFVRGGGRLLVIGEHDDMYGIARFQNEMLRPFGLAFRADAAGNREIDEHHCSSRVLGIKSAYNLLAATIRFLPNSLKPGVLLRSGAGGFGSKVIAGETRPGRGHVIALGDSEIFWNGDGRAGIHRGENRLLWIRLLKRFFPETAKRGTGQRETVDGATGDGATGHGARGDGALVFFDLSSDGRGPDDSQSGVRRFADYLRAAGHRVARGRRAPAEAHIRVIVGPLRAFKHDEKNRLLLFAESFDALEEFSYWDRLHLERGYRNRPSIYADFEKSSGLFIDACFISRTGGDFSGRALGPRLSIPLHRAGCIRVRDAGRFNIWLRAAPGFHGETLHPGMSDDRRMAALDDNDVRRPLVAVYDRRRLIFSDSDLVSNVHGDRVWFRALAAGILRWIGTGSPMPPNRGRGENNGRKYPAGQTGNGGP